ncbi:unnamed protein product, partial [Meganyctiphanes norvegica]
CLPGMKTEMEDWEKRYQIIISLENKREKLRELRRELMWAQVISSEKNVAALEKKLSSYDSEHNNYKEKLIKISEKKKEEDRIYKEVQEKFTTLMDHLKEHRVEENTAGQLEKTAKKNLKDAQAEVTAWQKDDQKIKKEKKEMQRAIETDHTGAWSNWTQKRNERLSKINQIKEERLRMNQEYKTEDTHQANLQ